MKRIRKERAKLREERRYDALPVERGGAAAGSEAHPPVTERVMDPVSPRPGERTAWHGLSEPEVRARLGTGPAGLTAEEAEERLRRYGPNRLEEIPPPSDLTILLHQFKSPLIYLLLVAAAVTLALGDVVDSAVIGSVLVLNAAIGFVQERRAEASVRALMGLVSPQARVVRGGREWGLESSDLVPGDVVLLESGVRVPADIRLTAATSLQIDESPLTGESLPVMKRIDPLDVSIATAERVNLAFTGTVVAIGRGRGYVVATGTATELGAISEHVRHVASAQTPLQQRMARLARAVGAVVGASAAIAFGVGVALGESASHMFKVAVALAVSAIPEGLPVVFTIALALGVRRMARRHAIIRALPAVETLGSTTVIGSDKTGTLTENQMTVLEVWAAGGSSPVPRDGESAPEVPEPLRLTLLTGIVANEAEMYLTDDGLETTGDPTEAALLVSGSRLGVHPETVRAELEEVASIPFEPERRYSASVRRSGSEHVLFVKGAPERVIAMSESLLTNRGEEPLDPEAVLGAARAMAARGLRVLAMAYRPAPPDTLVEEVVEGGRVDLEGLVFLGLQGMLDPPRAGVREAVEGCRRSGIRVVMITGDHALTATAIGRDLGIADGDKAALTGAELEAMDDEELGRRVGEVSIYARVSPEHKLRVVRALRRQGEVVAVTGDGVNDAPALKAADIGIAMGRSGTDVAREASDMILTDDNFVSIYAAVEEGRVTFENLRRVTFFLISSGAAEVVTIIVALLLRWELPLVAVQILWLNLVTNGIQDVALAFEPGEKDILKRRPRRRREGVISPLLWERIVVAGIVMAVGTLFIFWWELDHGASLENARTAALTTMVLFQAFHAGNSRSETRSVFAIDRFSNPFLLVGVTVALLVHGVALYVPATQFILQVEPIGATTWVLIVAVGVSIVAAMEGHKLLRRASGGGRPVT
jgi:calcium-translocating P-type ATPase